MSNDSTINFSPGWFYLWRVILKIGWLCKELRKGNSKRRTDLDWSQEITRKPATNFSL
jgi:hypothetical protein